MADAKPLVGTDYLIGIATTESTDTAAAAGYVDVAVLKGGEMLSILAKSASAMNTAAKIKAIANDFLVFDLAGTAWTIDTATGHVAANGLIATGTGEPENSRVYAWVRAAATFIGSDIAA
jgi:hypothetical protein